MVASGEPVPATGLETLSPWLEAHEIVNAAAREGVPVKLVGSVAVRWHCEKHANLFDLLDREPAHDLDLVVAKHGVKALASILGSSGLVQDRRIFQASDGQQLLFRSPNRDLEVDVYVEELRYCHVVSFNGVLADGQPTVPIAELLLTKLQIAELTNKDIKDVAIMLLEHDVAESDEAGGHEVIDRRRFVNPLTKNWGFWYTVDSNLKWIADNVAGMDRLSDAQRETIRTRLKSLRALSASSSKSAIWRMRSKIGTRLPWYQTVDDKD
jgi:hypothetical protein